MMADSFRSDVISQDVQTGELEIDRLDATRSIPPRLLPWHVRFGLSWSTGAVPVVLILLLGVALGPEGLAIITPGVLVVLDPVIPVAVAALGILAGLELMRPAAPNRWSLLRKASIESLATGVIVALGVWLIMAASPDFDASRVWLIAVLAGVCASMSATLPDADPDRLRPAAIRMRDLDGLLPSVVGGVVLAFLHSYSPVASLSLTIQAAILALLISATAWLLLADTVPSTEQRVFSIAALLLIGGIADYLSLSALVGGLLAGLFWGYVGGVARDCIERDVRYLRHPLVVLMLLTAGAKTTFSGWVVLLALAYLLFRVVGKLVGGWLARRARGVVIPERVTSALLPPGIFGIAFALDASSMMDGWAAVVLSAAVLGSIGSQLVAALWRPTGIHE
jgi:hypothetical protein